MDGSKENRNLELSSRNIRGVELIAGNHVHPYHLLRYETAIFSKPALEKLQDSLKAIGAQAQSGGGVMKSAYQIIRKPVITEKGLGVKENQGTLVFEVNAAATKTEVKEAVQKIFKVKVDSVRTANFVGKERRRGKFAGYRPDWKKAYVRLKAGEKMPEYAANI